MISENITKMITSNIYSHILYLGSSSGMFYVFDSRGTGSFLFKSQLHCSGIMDFALTENEKFALTSSLDRTINLIELDHDLLGLKPQGLYN